MFSLAEESLNLVLLGRLKRMDRLRSQLYSSYAQDEMASKNSRQPITHLDGDLIDDFKGHHTTNLSASPGDT